MYRQQMNVRQLLTVFNEAHLSLFSVSAQLPLTVAHNPLFNAYTTTTATHTSFLFQHKQPHTLLSLHVVVLMCRFSMGSAAEP